VDNEIEVTREMIEAGVEELFAYEPEREASSSRAILIYRAMRRLEPRAAKKLSAMRGDEQTPGALTAGRATRLDLSPRLADLLARIESAQAKGVADVLRG
jgi:hypothetical protein